MKLFYADTETTGLEPGKNEIVQFAYIIEKNKRIIDEGNILLRPSKWDCISDEALKITGKTIDDLKAYPDRRSGYRELLYVLGQHVDKYDRNDKLIWVGQNPRFDMDFTRAFFGEFEDKYFGSCFRNHPVDLMALAVAVQMRGFLEFENMKLGTICQVLGIPLGDDAHDALADIQATRNCFHHLMLNYVADVSGQAEGG